MNIGLPGTGIGALFYILLVLAMPARELWNRWTRPHLRRSWRFIGRQLGMAVAMLAVFWIEMQLITSQLHCAVVHPVAVSGAGAHGHGTIGSYLYEQASRSTIASLTMMFAILATVHVVALLGRLRERSRA